MSDLKRTKEYARRKLAVFFADIFLTLAFLAAVQFSGLSSYLRDIAFRISPNYYPALLAYISLFSAALYIFLLPLGFYSGFRVEHRFNLSNQSLRRWAGEEAKKAVLSFAIFAVLVELLYLVLRSFPKTWWVIASLGWIGFSALFARLLPSLIIPLFYKYKKISDSSLREKIMDLTARAKIKVTDVFEIDFSRNTKKSNAAFVGWGRTRRIILADNLLKEFSQEEIEVVVAHEMAHYKLRHIWKSLFFGCATTFLLFYVLHISSAGVATYFEANGIQDIAIFPAMAFIFSAVSMLFLPLQNTYLRKLEKDADIFALQLTNLKGAFITLMEKFSSKNLSDKDPNRIIEFLVYDHPSISRRIELARRFGEGK